MRNSSPGLLGPTREGAQRGSRSSESLPVENLLLEPAVLGSSLAAPSSAILHEINAEGEPTLCQPMCQVLGAW